MVTILADKDSVSKIQDACRKLAIESNPLDPVNIRFDDDFYVFDYTHAYAVGIAKRIKTVNPKAKIVMYYPAVRSYVRSEIEKMGFMPFTSVDFFSKLKSILQGKM